MRTKLFLLFTLFSLAISAQISQVERQALIDFYNATDGDNWTNNTNWDTDINGTSDVFSWYGITKISHNDGVTEFNYIGIDLSNNNLTGDISSIDFSAFDYKLSDLNVSNNNLTGGLLGVIFPDNQDYYGFYDYSKNKYQFGALELIYPLDENSNLSIYIGNQQNVSADVTINVPLEAELIIEAVVTGTSNSYQWFKNDVAIAGATNKNYSISSVENNDFASYYCKVSNTIVTDFILQTGNFKVEEGIVGLAALKALYNATDGVNWTNNTNWLDDEIPVSDWYGITVETIAGREVITKIELPNNNLNGTIPDFSSLLELKEVDFSENTLITGAIRFENSPSTIAKVDFSNTGINALKLNRFVDLNIKNTPNLFCVEVPEANLDQYYNLSMDNFDFGDVITTDCSSVLPLDAVEISALEDLYANTLGNSWSQRTYNSTIIKSTANTIDYKGFETIEVNGFRKIVRLRLRGMNLNGAIPASIKDFTELIELDLTSNQINNLPTEIGALSKLQQFYMNSNSSLTSLPNSIGDLLELLDFQFSNTQIDLIPTSLGNLKKLQTLEFASTRITLLPPQIGGLIELTRLVAAPNNIASIPSEFGQLTKLQFLDFANCELSNTPAAFANLTELKTLYLNDNELQVVSGLGGFTKLKFLRLHNNRLGEDNPNFNTDLPEDLGDLVDLEELTLNNNQLTELPNSIGNLTFIKVLPLQGNNLTKLPATIGGLTSLEELYLGNRSGQGNDLTALPAEIGSLLNLKLLYAQYNRLATLPTEIGNLSKLENLDVSNQISYNPTTYYMTSLPASINNLTSLKDFRATGNRIAGDINIS
ncbi:leucine-rich repeat domain-containing protein, partial [uncultured Polaribacter sp.]|uniref:leucine-rich repeat domain-containing protein n=1 Tax=uncultured Polaribacter sp. TaxID=174711 RepID=UPI00345A0AA7